MSAKNQLSNHSNTEVVLWQSPIWYAVPLWISNQRFMVFSNITYEHYSTREYANKTYISIIQYIYHMPGFDHWAQSHVQAPNMDRHTKRYQTAVRSFFLPRNWEAPNCLFFFSLLLLLFNCADVFHALKETGRERDLLFPFHALQSHMSPRPDKGTYDQ